MGEECLKPREYLRGLVESNVSVAHVVDGESGVVLLSELCVLVGFV